MTDDDITYESTEQTSADATIWQKLLEIQRDLKVEKGQWNQFGKYNYRSKEDILEAAKPLCHSRGIVLKCDDEIVDINGWKYVMSIAILIDVASKEQVKAQGYAREPETKKGMDSSQITGTAASYAGKRALGNLFALDDTKDSDAPDVQLEKEAPTEGPFTARCRVCGRIHSFTDNTNYEQWISYWAQGGTENRCCPSPMLEVL